MHDYLKSLKIFVSHSHSKLLLALKHSPSKRKGVTSKPQPRPSATSESEASRSYLPKIPSESECTQEEGLIFCNHYIAL